MIVICRIKQISPDSGRPIVKNVNHGKNNAINKRMDSLLSEGKKERQEKVV